MPDGEQQEAQGPTPDQVVLTEERQFIIGDREVTLRPFPIGEYKRVAGTIGTVVQEIVRDHPEIDLAKPEEHLEAIIPIFAQVLGRVLERLIGVEEDYLDEHLTLVQASEIIVALLEINQLPAIRKNCQRASSS